MFQNKIENSEGRINLLKTQLEKVARSNLSRNYRFIEIKNFTDSVQLKIQLYKENICNQLTESIQKLKHTLSVQFYKIKSKMSSFAKQIKKLKNFEKIYKNIQKILNIEIMDEAHTCSYLTKLKVESEFYSVIKEKLGFLSLNSENMDKSFELLSKNLHCLRDFFKMTKKTENSDLQLFQIPQLIKLKESFEIKNSFYDDLQEIYKGNIFSEKFDKMTFHRKIVKLL